MDESQRLRALAEWYREFAVLSGGALQKAHRLALADRIEARARDLEQARLRDKKETAAGQER